MADVRDKGKTGDTGTGASHMGGAGQGMNQGQGGNQGGSTMGAVKHNVQEAADKVGQYASQARDKAQEWAGDARDALGNAGDRVQHWASEAYDVAGDKMGDFGREVTTMVRRYPIPALLVGFGVGLLIGRAARA